jgi:vanillate O-demethylase monooxygenase subunit
MHVRNFGVGDAPLEASLIDGMNQTFNEDNVICTAIQREQEVTGVRQYTWLSIDAGPARVRRMLEQLAAAEAGTPEPTTKENV